MKQVRCTGEGFVPKDAAQVTPVQAVSRAEDASPAVEDFPAVAADVSHGASKPNFLFSAGASAFYAWHAAARAQTEDAPIDIAKNPVYHIVEEPGAVERMIEVEIPPESYYKALRKDLAARYPKASPFVIDHLVSLEAFLDVSIRSGFSFGCAKAKVLQHEGALLGRIVSRTGVKGDLDRAKAVHDFAPIVDLKSLQQFLGCANWLRQHLPTPYVCCVKHLSLIHI